jgi:hypothetical protein
MKQAAVATFAAALFLAGSADGVCAEPVRWRDFTPDLYLVGRGFSDHEDTRQRQALARDDALAMLSRSVRAHVTSRTETLRMEAGGTYSEAARIHNVSTTNVEVSGVHFLDRVDANRVEVLAYLSYEEARRVHYQIAEGVIRDIGDAARTARRLSEVGDRGAALDAYASMFPLFSRLDDLRAVLVASRGASPILPFTRASITNEMSELEDAPVSSIKDAVELLVLRLAKSGSLGERLRVKPFTHDATEFASPFSQRVHRLLEAELGSRVAVFEGSFTPKSVDYVREEALQADSDMVLSGSYSESQDSVSIFARAVDSNSRLRASAEVIVPKTLVVEERLALQPENYAQARQDAALIAAGEALSGPLRIEMWTDLGRDALLFTTGQRYRLFVRANAACTVRLLYHLSDGTRVVMYEDYAIPAGRANQPVEIPEPFVVTAPYGAEIIQAFAYAGSPPSMKVRERTIAGMPYTVVDEPLDAVMEAFMKGFARGGGDGDGAAPPSATVQLSLTTVPLP